MVGSVLVLGHLVVVGVGLLDRHLRGMDHRRMEREVLERYVVGRPVMVELELPRPLVELGRLELTR